MGEAERTTDETACRMRIDFTLQEHMAEGIVESYGVYQSHFCYWTSHDLALFVLKKISQHDTAELNAVEHEQKEAESRASAEAAAATAASAEALVISAAAADELTTRSNKNQAIAAGGALAL